MRIHEAGCRECGAPVQAVSAKIAGADVTIAPLCQACGEIESARQEAAEEQERNALLWKRWRALCPPLYRDCDERILRAAGNGAGGELLDKVLSWQYGPRGMILSGPTGVGKTRCVWQLIKRLLREGRRIEAFDAVRFGHECSTRFSEMDGPALWLQNLAGVEVLFLDDFGKIKLTDRVESELFGLIERRTALKKPLLVTTNFDGEGLLEKMTSDRGEPMLRRLREFCNCISVAENGKLDIT